MSAATLGASSQSGSAGPGGGACAGGGGASGCGLGTPPSDGVRLRHREVPAGLNSVLAGTPANIPNVPRWGRVKKTGLFMGSKAIQSLKVFFLSLLLS